MHRNCGWPSLRLESNWRPSVKSQGSVAPACKVAFRLYKTPPNAAVSKVYLGGRVPHKGKDGRSFQTMHRAAAPEKDTSNGFLWRPTTQGGCLNHGLSTGLAQPTIRTDWGRSRKRAQALVRSTYPEVYVQLLKMCCTYIPSLAFKGTHHWEYVLIFSKGHIRKWVCLLLSPPPH